MQNSHYITLHLNFIRKKSPNMNSSPNQWNLENTYAELPEGFFSLQKPIAAANPRLLLYNKQLANDLGLSHLDSDPNKTAALLGGNEAPPDGRPLAQAYAGHQFGHFTMLGDGRAILLGEQITPIGDRIDIQLKGAGRTAYSRRGDGRATLYSMLREYVISEAMHYMGIPTTRSLAVVTTGEEVFREEIHQGAVLTRTSSSHIRVGTFQYARNMRPIEDLKALTQYTINRHYPELNDRERPALELLKAVMEKQIDLVVNWLRVGFIHGVMNTDNMSISGETIDYGPCAFMNAYNLKTVYSSIDNLGRYAFGNQANITRWNLTAFADSMLPLIADNEHEAIQLAQEVIDSYQEQFTLKYFQMHLKKLGIVYPEDSDKELVTRLFAAMEISKADYTQTYLSLQMDKELEGAVFKSHEFATWKDQWQAAKGRNGAFIESDLLMNQNNPRVIPRNHWVEKALETAVAGDLSYFTELLSMLQQPYHDHPENLMFEKSPSDFDLKYQTFCGT